MEIFEDRICEECDEFFRPAYSGQTCCSFCLQALPAPPRRGRKRSKDNCEEEWSADDISWASGMGFSMLN